MKFFFSACLLVLFFNYGLAQDSSSFAWKVSSLKKGEGRYELRFSTDGNARWDLYAPGSVFADIAASTLIFSDSSIQMKEPLKSEGESKQIQNAVFDNHTYQVYQGPAVFTAIIQINGPIPATLLGTFSYTYGKGDEFYPQESIPFSVELEGGVQADTMLRIESVDLANPVQDCGTTASEPQKMGLLSIFLLGFLGGLVALLTPCVFPMVPLTVSFFTKRSGAGKTGAANAILYGLFILLIYIAFSIPFHIAGKVSPTIYNDIATNVWLNVSFFIVFILFAISFFGYYEITLPGSLANSANTRQGTDLIGIFFMALTLAIVSFSCTGPILGTLLVGTASEGAWPLTAGLAGFGLALGLPFGLFAMFPQWLHALPRSGGWLNTVKVVLGFIELALALKFLSNADLVAHWGVLRREIFFGIWILIFLGLFLYLMGWLRFPHDDRSAKVSGMRRALGMVVLAFTLYLLPGVTNSKWANISMVSGFPPPHCYSLYAHPVNCEEPLKDYAEALKLAKTLNKPIMIDFTGWACVNCRKMEENVWPDREVKKRMEQYVLVSLYVDDKAVLPATSQIQYVTRDSIQKKIITVGDKWSTFQTENFVASSQPWYVLLSTDEKLLVPPAGYTPDSEAFSAWLQCGLDAFRQKPAERLQ
jgi:thiol:disulfide interchange protein DsbD